MIPHTNLAQPELSYTLESPKNTNSVVNNLVLDRVK